MKKMIENQVELEEEELYQATLDVVRDPACIRAVLSAHEIPLSGRKEENIRSLERLAKELGRNLCFHKVSAQE
jgi:hypothetical protein